MKRNRAEKDLKWHLRFKGGKSCPTTSIDRAYLLKFFDEKYKPYKHFIHSFTVVFSKCPTEKELRIKLYSLPKVKVNLWYIVSRIAVFLALWSLISP